MGGRSMGEGRMDITIRQDSISDQAALAAVTAAVQAGRDSGCAMNAAVVDAGGNLVAFLRASGGFLPSVGIAMDKAYTAAAFGMSTDALHHAVQDPAHLHDGIASRDRVVLFGGGFPIVHDGRVIGGIGCSGGSEEDDRRCARAGLKALGIQS